MKRTGYCECGCGRKTNIAKKSNTKREVVKGQPLRFCPGHNRNGGKRRVAERYKIEDRGYRTPCWVWQLAKSPKGYGQEWNGKRRYMVGAHITAYESAKGPVPDGKEIDHLCRQRDCVNPDHLQAVDHTTNVRRRSPGGWATALGVRLMAATTSISTIDIAEAFGFDTGSAVRRIVRGETWSESPRTPSTSAAPT